MKKYRVDLPIAGYISLEVDAENEDDAIEKALDSEWTHDDIQELDAYKRLVQGNVCYTWHTRAEAEIIDEDE
jgi:hypothetical protein